MIAKAAVAAARRRRKSRPGRGRARPCLRVPADRDVSAFTVQAVFTVTGRVAAAARTGQTWHGSRYCLEAGAAFCDSACVLPSSDYNFIDLIAYRVYRR